MSALSQDMYRFGHYELSPSRLAFYRDGAEIPLTPRSFDVLLYLVRNPGRLITKEELLKAVWADAFIEESNLAQQIFRLRKAFEADPEGSHFIRTVPGRGYQFTADVEHRPPPAIVPGPVYTTPIIEGWRERTHIVVEEFSPPSRRLSPPRTSKRYVPLASSTVATIILAGAIWQWHAHSLHVSHLSHQVVVAEFLNTTGDTTFDHTLTRALDIDLSQSPYMDVMTERDVIDTLKLMGQKPDVSLSADLARQVCIRSNRQTLLTPSISGVGHQYLLTLEATDCGTGKVIASDKAESSTKENVLASLDSLADRMRSRLGETVKSVESYRVPIAQATTPSLEALQAYSLGTSLIAHGEDDNAAITFYQKAIELDPKFAMAYCALGNAYYNISEYDQASENFAKAFSLSDQVSVHEKLYIRSHFYGEGRYDLESGIRNYKVWAATYPGEYAPLVNLAGIYTQLGQFLPAIEAAKQALQLQPDRAINYSVLVRAYMHAGRFAESRAVAQLAIDRHIDSVGLHSSLFSMAAFERDADKIASEHKFFLANNSGWYAWYFPYIDSRAAAARGNYSLSEDLTQKSFEAARDQKALESVDDILTSQALVEFDLGFPATTRATIARIKNQHSLLPDLAILHCELGDTSLAERYLVEHAKEAANTFMAYIYLPRVRAALAMRRGKPLEAVTALNAGRPYELADFDIPFARAESYLKAGQADLAATTYQQILASPGADPLSYKYDLAYLGLARAYALEHKSAESIHEYETFFSVWHGADTNIPVLKQAHLEYAHLTPSHLQ